MSVVSTLGSGFEVASGLAFPGGDASTGGGDDDDDDDGVASGGHRMRRST
jgi:hypothetical protein